MNCFIRYSMAPWISCLPLCWAKSLSAETGGKTSETDGRGIRVTGNESDTNECFRCSHDFGYHSRPGHLHQPSAKKKRLLFVGAGSVRNRWCRSRCPPIHVYSLAGHSGARTNRNLSDCESVLPVNPVSAGTAVHEDIIRRWSEIRDFRVGLDLGFGLVLCILYLICQHQMPENLWWIEPVENDFTIQWLTEYQLRRPVSIRQSGK